MLTLRRSIKAFIEVLTQVRLPGFEVHLDHESDTENVYNWNPILTNYATQTRKKGEFEGAHQHTENTDLSHRDLKTVVCILWATPTGQHREKHTSKLNNRKATTANFVRHLMLHKDEGCD